MVAPHPRRADVFLAPPPRLSPQNVGEMVRFHRTRQGLTIRALAKLAGTSPTSVFFLETGKDGTGKPFYGLKVGSDGLQLLQKIVRALLIDEGEVRAAVAQSAYHGLPADGNERIGYFLRKPSEQGKVLLFSPR